MLDAVFREQPLSADRDRRQLAGARKTLNPLHVQVEESCVCSELNVRIATLECLNRRQRDANVPNIRHSTAS
jgi:hypothetical protein